MVFGWRPSMNEKRMKATNGDAHWFWKNESSRSRGYGLAKRCWNRLETTAVRVLVPAMVSACASIEQGDEGLWWGFEERVGSVSRMIVMAKSESECEEERRRGLPALEKGQQGRDVTRCGEYRARGGSGDLQAHLPHDWGFFVTRKDGTEILVVADKSSCEFRQKLFWPSSWAKTTLCEPAIVERQ